MPENPDLFSTVRMKGDALDIFKKEKKEVERDQVRISKDGGAILVIIAGPDEGKVIVLDRPRRVLGRTDDADIVIPEPHISRRHAQFETQGKQVTVIDLKSTNGTYVNTRRIDQAVLHDGDEIQVGDAILKFFQEDLGVTTAGAVPSCPEADQPQGGSPFFRRVFLECQPYFGVNTERFLNRQITAHLGKTKDTLTLADKYDLLKWIKISASLYLDDSATKELSNKVLSLE